MAVKYVRYLLIIFLALAGCETAQQTYTTKPTRSLSHPEADLLEVNAVVYHEQDSLSRIYLQISNENLLYKRPDTSRVFYADIKVSFVLSSEKDSRRIIDSNSFRANDRSETEHIHHKFIYSSFPVKAILGSIYQLEIDVWDLSRRTRYKKQVRVNKLNRFSAQNFLVYRSDSISFMNGFPAEKELRVMFNGAGAQALTVNCYFKEFGPALPPFSTKDIPSPLYSPDSIFTLPLTDRMCSFVMPKKGFYLLKPSNSEYDGLALPTVDESFPGVGSSDEMIHCTRYIMSKEEYDNCLKAADKKIAIDEFWLNIGGSHERAKELIRKYYGRVKEANRNYSTFLPGWKTDRGMIYIVFGLPVSVYTNQKNEVWVYGNEANPNSLRFVFQRTENPLSDNEYVLDRSVFYKDPYHTAVEYWRQGLIYTESPR